jgi:hypothetical protein
MLPSEWVRYLVSGLLAVGAVGVALILRSLRRRPPPAAGPPPPVPGAAREAPAEYAIPPLWVPGAALPPPQPGAPRDTLTGRPLAPRGDDLARSPATPGSFSAGMLLHSRSGWSAAAFYLLAMPVILWGLSLLVLLVVMLSGALQHSDLYGVVILGFFFVLFPAGTWSFPWCLAGLLGLGKLGLFLGPFLNAAILQQVVARRDAATERRRGEPHDAQGRPAPGPVAEDPHEPAGPAGFTRFTRSSLVGVLLAVVTLAITVPAVLAPVGQVGLGAVGVTLAAVFIVAGLLLWLSIERQR